MRVLLYGARGYLGRYLAQLLASRAEVFEGQARGEHADKVDAEIEAAQPDVLLVCIGRTHGPGAINIDYLEQPQSLKENLKDNLEAPLTLARLGHARGLHTVFVGTGCIYHSVYDTAGHATSPPFTEDDPPNFSESAYSAVKATSDRLMQPYHAHVLNLRIRLVLGPEAHPRNTLTKLISYPRICSLDNSVTTLSLFDECLWPLLEQRATGNLNFTHPGVVSQAFILEAFADCHPTALRPTYITPEELAALLPARRSNCVLSTQRLEHVCPSITPAREAVLRTVRRYPT